MICTIWWHWAIVLGLVAYPLVALLILVSVLRRRDRRKHGGMLEPGPAVGRRRCGW